MLSIGMLLFCITKLKLLSWNYVPDLQPDRTRQKHQAETTLIQYHNI